MQHQNLGLPQRQGLYDPQFEHDACGIGFVVNIKGQKSHSIVRQALTVLSNLAHRGGAGSEDNTGDGAGILLQVPDKFFRSVCPQSHRIAARRPLWRRHGVPAPRAQRTQERTGQD